MEVFYENNITKRCFGTFLINKKDAVLATQTSMNRLKEENREKEIKENETIKKCEEIKKKLENIKIQFKVKTGAEDRVFGSISPKQIVEELKNKGFDIDKKQIKIDESISSLGFHNVDIQLHKKVVATIKIELTK